MALMRNVGKRIWSTRAGKPAGGIAGVGGAFALGGTIATVSAAKAMFSAEERETPFVDALFEGVIGDAQADRHILGTDVGLSTLYGLPDLNPIPRILPWPRVLPSADQRRLMRMVNPKTFGDISQSDQQNIQGRSYNGFVLDQAENNVRAHSSGGRPNMNATGDIVFGMWNSRMG